MTALGIIGVFLLLSLALGVLARRGRTMSLENWSVGGRGFGTLFVFLLMAGEIYTTFTFLGASGWAYGRGAPAFYILCYGSLAYSMSYLPLHYYGGLRPMFEAIDRAKPQFLTLPGSGMSSSWFISTVLLSALGFYMW